MRKFKYIYGWMLFLLFFYSCMQNPQISETNVEERIFQLVNEHRDALGLRTLVWNEEISMECRIHSRNMANGTVPVSHDGFDDRVKNIRQILPLSSAGENIGFISGYTNPAVAIFNEWINSPGHIKNIEGGFDLTGVGAARSNKGDYYITQIFVKSDPGQ